MAESFDPDKYLEEKGIFQKKQMQPSDSFDPDKYISEKLGTQNEPSEGFLDRLSSLNPFSKSGRDELNKRIEDEKIKSGYYESKDAQAKKEKGEALAALEGAGNFITLGYLPQIQAGTRKGLKNVYEAYTGEKVPEKSYLQARDENIEKLQKLSEENPKSYYGAGLLGAAAQTVATGGVSGAGKIVSALPKAVESAPLVGNALKGAIYGAEAGLLSNPGDIKGKLNPIQAPERIEQAIESAKTGAKLGVAGEVASKALKAAPGLGKKALTVMFGPNKNQIDYYLKNSKDVNNAKSLPELKDKVDSIISKLKEDVDAGKTNVDSGKELLKRIDQQISDLNEKNSFSFRLDQRDISSQLNRAKDDLEKAYSGKVQSLKDIKAPTNLSEDVVQASKELKQKIGEGSEFAKQALDTEGKVDVFNSFKDLDSAIESMKISNVGFATPQAQSAANEIGKLKDLVGKLPSEVSLKDAKKLIQQIDRSEQVIYNSPEFSGDVQNAYRNLRISLDKRLKEVSPEYAKRMKPVAEMTGLYSDIAPKFGEKTSAISSLNRIGSPTSEVDRANLIRLGQLTGRDYESPINEYLAAQGQLKDPRALNAIRESLPEFQKYNEIQSMANRISDPRTKEAFLQNELEKSGLLGKRESAQGLLSDYEKGLLSAKEKAEPFRGLTEGTSESKIKSLLSAKPGEKIEIRKQMQELSKLSDVDFEKAIRDLQNKEAFQGGRPIGSRNTNLFALTLGGLGAMAAGPVGAGAGASAGASIGATVDKFGGPITKKILDAVIRMGENPTVQKINALNIPPNAKQYLIQSLTRYKATEK